MNWREQGEVKILRTGMMVTLPLFLFFILLPFSKSQEDFLDQHQEWNYREGADKVNIEGINSLTQTLEKWGNGIFWQMKDALLNNPNALLPEFSSSGRGTAWSDPGAMQPQLHHGMQQHAFHWEALTGDPTRCCSLLYSCWFQPSRLSAYY
ncbi:uncharacterized protein PRD47_013522 isoform 3-T4 [Ara ararauna]